MSENPNAVVMVGKAQTIDGQKTFSQPIVGDITGTAGDVSSNTVVRTSGNQSVSGIKSFASIKTDSLISKSPVIDVRAIPGMVVDGVADDASVLNAFITSLGTLSGPVTIWIPPSVVCGVKSPITIISHLQLKIDGELRALSPFTGNPVIQGIKDATGYDENFSIVGDGIVNANNIANDGISIKRGRFGEIDVRIWGAVRYGARLGDITATSHSYQIDFKSPLVWRGDYENASGSIGVYHENCSDSYVLGCVTQGFRIGFKTDSNSVHYFACHSWGRKLNGPLTHCFYSNANDCTYHGCDADTPHNTRPDGTKDGSITDVYSFYLARFNNFLYGCRSFINPSDPPGVATDAIVSAVYIAQASGLFGGIFGLRASGSALFRHKNMIGGTQDNVTVLGISDDGNIVNGTTSFQKLGYKTLKVDVTSTFNASVTMAAALTASSTVTVAGTATLNGATVANGGVDSKGTGGGQVNVSANASGQAADVVLRTGTSNRWRVRKNADVESGGNAGSNFRIDRFDDSGVYQNSPIEITRSSGVVLVRSLFLGDLPTFASNAAALAGGLGVGGVYRNGDALMIVH